MARCAFTKRENRFRKRNSACFGRAIHTKTAGKGEMSQQLREIAKKHEWHNVRWFKRMAPLYDVVEVFARHIR